jgi:FKBP-type peptidyl-prolyl cis-trans isomerase FkpA
MKSFLFPACLAAVLTLGACGGNVDPDGPAMPAASPSALKTVDIAAGSGAVVASGSRVQVNYTGWLYDPAAPDGKGAKYDASAPGKPFTFVIGLASGDDAAIAGISQGVIGMRVGGRRTIQVPASLAYGGLGVPGLIPSNTGLVFDVELVKICGTVC